MPKCDWSRYEKAKQLRDGGLTYKAVGAELGVGMQRAREMVLRYERYERKLLAEKENPKLIPWWRGLTPRTVRVLESHGFKSKEDCRALCGNLTVERGVVIFAPTWPLPKYQWWDDLILTIKVANDVREWLGVAPIIPPPRAAAPGELERAKRLLIRYGYTVTPPASGEQQSA